MIRKAVGSDFNDYYRLICELEEQVFEKTSFHELYDRILNHPMYELYVYEENEQVIGIMTLFFSEKLHHASFATFSTYCFTDSLSSALT